MRIPRFNLLSTTIRAVLVGVAVYLVMRFLVPHSADKNMRSLAAGGAALVASLIIGRLWKPRTFWRW